MPEKRSHKRFSKQAMMLSWLVLLGLGALLVVPERAVADTVTFTTSGSWVVPAGVTSVTVEAWGAGGGGGTSGGNKIPGGGGGGGEYRKADVAVFELTSYAYTVGVGGTGANNNPTVNGTAGGDTTFDTNKVVAKGGNGGLEAGGGAGGTGGSFGAGTSNYTNWNGGTGGNGVGSDGGAGGGGAGSAGAGGTGGSGITVGAAGAGDGTAGTGGAGGIGGNGIGSAGNIYGGGGGAGVGRTGTGANGAGGFIRLTWTPPAIPPALTTPTATSITATSAVLGATVTAGEPLTARGTVWGTSANPTGNQLAEGGTTNSAYSHARSVLPEQSKIFYRGYAINPSGTSYSADGSFYTEPAAQASGVNFSGVSATGMTINWTRGTGGAGGGVIVLVKAATAVDSAPVDGTYSGYAADPIFASGTQLGVGNYVVYKGTGSSVAVTGLSPVTTYHVAVYEFAGQIDTVGVNQGTNYTATAATNSQTTPADAPSLVLPTATSITATTATLGATVTSDGGAAVTARGTVWDTTPNPTVNLVAEGGTGLGIFSHGRSTLPPQTKLYYRGYATNTADTGYSVDGSFYTEPATSPTNLFFNLVGKNGMTINWTRGSAGAGGGVIVLMKAATAVDANPVDGTYSGYTANANFSSGTQLGSGNYVVYKGTGTSVAVTGLNAATTYHVSIYEFMGQVDTVGVDQGTNYKLTSLNGNRGTDADVPVLANPTASNVLITTATFGATVTSDGGAPLTSRGTCWDTAPNPTINCATAFGTTVDAFTYARSGLPEGSKVYFNGYANNASAGRGYSPDGVVYMEPIQPTGLTISAVGETGMTIGWTIASSGSHDNYLVVMRAASPVATAPSDGTTYTANAAFGTGDALGSSSVVYKGTGSSVAVTGLTASTTYHVKVYAFAAEGATTENYNLVLPLVGSQVTDDPPATIPLLSTPTGSAVTTTTAILGATVTSNGGETLLERGTCWDLIPAPTANCQTEGDVLVGAYSHTRALLPEGTAIYYRGYAKNSFVDTGYSPDGVIYTEPEQPAILTFDPVTQNSMTIGWTINSSGNADNVLVVMRAASPVATAPSDGTTYSANAAYGTGGTELGASYVVYKGAATSVVVTGLTPSTSYYVTVYAFAAGGSGTENYNLASPLENSRATADPPPCFRAVPTITLGSPQSIDESSTASYTVSVTNFDSGGGCGATTFTVSVPGGADTGNTVSFATPSVLASGPSCTITNLVEGGVDKSCVLEVTSQASPTAINGHVMNTVVQVTSAVQPDHGIQSNNINTTISFAYGCDDCHGNRTTFKEYPTDSATRTVTGGTEGNHAIHVDPPNGYACITCHVNNTNGLHLNTSIEMKAGATAISGGFYDKIAGGAYTAADASWSQTSTVNVTTQSCYTTYCHGSGSDVWGTAIAGDTCTKCHGVKGQASPTDAQIAPGGTGVDTNGNSAANDPQVGAHQTHLTSNNDISSDIACSECHVKPTNPTDAGHNDNALPADMTWGAIATANTTTPTYNGTNCTNYCHGANLASNGDATSDGSDRTPLWTNTTYLNEKTNFDTDCGRCHGFPPKGYAGSHEAMTANDGTACISCHDHVKDGTNASEAGWATGAFSDVTKHINGTVDASGCNGCHGGIDASTNEQYWPDGVPATPAYADNTVGAHDNHVLALAEHLYGITTLDALRADASTGSKQVAICAVCHPSPGAGGHDTDSGDSRVDLLAAANFKTYDGANTLKTDTASSAYSLASQNCTVTCHNQVLTPNTWTTPGAATCATCHPTGSYTNRHDTHVTTEGYACTECHVNNVVSGSFPTATDDLRHADGRVDMQYNNTGSFEQVNGDGQINYDATGLSTTDALVYKDASWGTCATAACHNTKTTPIWSLAATGSCTICHTVGGSGTVEPTTGLHDETGVVSGIAHNPTAPGINACTDCHNATPSAAHINGTVGAALAASDFADTALIGTITTAGTPTCTSSCHSDNNTWARQWHENSDVAVSPTSTACAGCHGTFTTGFNTGVALRHTGTDADNDIVNSHDGTDTCVTCHTYDGADTYGHQWATHHDNANIEVSDQVGFVDNGATVGCGVCHSSSDGTADEGHEFTDTAARWTSSTIAGPVAGCGSCHTDGVQTGSASATHTAHGATSADLIAGGPWPDCVQCHPNVNYDLGHSGALQFANVTYSGGENGTCFTTSCHNQGSGGQDQSNAWDSATQLECNDCHYYEVSVSSANNTSHLAPLTNRHDSHFVKNVQCATCHAVPAAGDTAHISAGTLADMAVATFGEATVGGSKTIAYTSPNCSTGITGLGCHATAATEAWNQAPGAIVCTDCHTDTSTAAVNPTSGLHTGPGTVSGITHHPSDAAFAACTTCHDATPSSSHVDGNLDALAGTDFDASGNVTTFTAGATPTCNAVGTCHSDGGGWARKWHGNSTAGVAPTSNACAGCHGTFTTGFNTGVTLRHTGTDADNDIVNSHNGTDTCVTCHTYDGADTYGHKWATHHDNGNIEISDAVSFADNVTTVGCSGCHVDNDGTADEGHEFTDAGAAHGWGRTLVAGPVAGCTGCHNGTNGLAGDARRVTSGGTHMAATRGGVEQDCSYCHPMHAGGVLIPNNATLGINYTADSRTGFRLGGSGTIGTTEAEICWNCHDDTNPDISEWDGTSATYDYGTVTQNNLNWLTTSWSSARTEFAYKNGTLATRPGSQASASTHGVKGGAAGVDTIGNIGCSYCHDVHNGTDGSVAATKGKPYVRGTWQSNPYLEDGAPRSGAGQTIDSVYWGLVPRGSLNTNYGGYQIDQNNGSPALTANSAAGLCELCHGNGDGSWTTGELGAIGASVAWVSTGNSHAYVVKGGLLTGGFNLYNESQRLWSTGFQTGTASGDFRGSPGMSYGHLGTGVRGYGFRGVDGSAYGDTPAITGSTRPYGQDNYVWGATIDVGTVDGGYHQFSCSKCHNPHASRLPKLMITNCLDTKVNTWDNTLTTPTASVSTENNGVGYSNATSAQNCHRLADPAFSGKSGGNGWNTATPW